MINWMGALAENLQAILVVGGLIFTGIMTLLGKLILIHRTLKRTERHNRDNYMNILRLTVTNTSMPMSERLKAGKKYTDEGGNGEVAALYKKLEREFMKEDAK